MNREEIKQYLMNKYRALSKLPATELINGRLDMIESILVTCFDMSTDYDDRTDTLTFNHIERI